MKFRPCIDIHNGQVKQIVGASLKDAGDQAAENFVSHQDAAYYAKRYKEDRLVGGHVILLNGSDSPYYEQTKAQALGALKAYPMGLQLGGGVNPENAEGYLDAGASHVIVTSYVFRDGRIRYGNLEKMAQTVGRDRLVLDLSCRKRGDAYYVVTDRWQKFTDVPVDTELFEQLGAYCDEFLVHGVDVEGSGKGIDQELLLLLAAYRGRPITYAGGVGSEKDLEEIRIFGKGKIDFTVGSALDLFGGTISYASLCARSRTEEMHGPNEHA